ncbi:hypothetical protein ACIA7R_28765 [Micromonospora chalcea]
MSAVHHHGETAGELESAEKSAVAKRLESASPGSRLVLRSHPALIVLTLVLGLVEGSRKLRTLRRILADNQQAELHPPTGAIQALEGLLQQHLATLNKIAITLVYAEDSDFERVRPVANALAHSLARTASFNLGLNSLQTHTSSVAELGRLAPMRDNIRDIERNVALSAKLAHSLAGGLEDESGLSLARRTSRHLGLDPAFAADLHLAIALAFDIASDAKQSVAGLLARRIDGLRSDFVGADLRNAPLSSINLSGVRWSSTTQWPPEWAGHVRRTSIVIGPDLFEVQPGSADVPSDAGLIRA